MTNREKCDIIYTEREETTMTREEKIERLIKGQQLLTFEQWYEINQWTFIFGKNKNDPKRLYEEYVAEVLGE